MSGLYRHIFCENHKEYCCSKKKKAFSPNDGKFDMGLVKYWREKIIARGITEESAIKQEMRAHWKAKDIVLHRPYAGQ
jgi:hypothetical protein